ncbi:PREDICTED: sushi, von Willebrand factor type A, EGF and pentraxin domain-containing protein 1-like [Branchiostoma belcheri]|uniref:Sushi, von Willebrand factor type A, EGF and pentraxin domain-containing protein 1-like n=1 Tax=Branchiostoma belcheri TaxID=7741 RepID=A0A6P4YHL8_BRABE|nr:PREDICTED: sushi, von Willebrand factor type A, EGF and pentraxin domain-containing protein 1-like [Branchiostoma belcheri]
MQRFSFGLAWMTFDIFCHFLCPEPPPPDTTVPTIECPNDIHVSVPPLETTAAVSWIEPIAHDNRDPHVSTRRDPEELEPGVTLHSGAYRLTYSATDASGNSNSCSFIITVGVTRCPHPSLIIPQVEQGIMLVRFYPDSNDILLGTTFVATCKRGYAFGDGSTQNIRTCTSSGAWDGADVTCRGVQCNPLRPPFRGIVTCTDDNNFLSVCTYSCNEGFDISSGTNRVRVCTAAAEWTGIEPRCRDIIRPTLVDCPGPLIIEYLDMNEREVTVVWEEPTVEDNADYGLTASLCLGDPPGSPFTVGTHRIEYTATDNAGNTAIPCGFTLSIREITCPVVHKKPYQLVTCPSGNSYGSRCEFACEDGSRLIGANFTYCDKTGDPAVGYWDWDSLAGQHSGSGDYQGQPKCEGHPCRALRVPHNGALACDAWLYGKHCTMLCNDRYDIPPGLRIRNSLWVCGTSGNWDYPDPPHCSVRRRPNSIRLPSELQYFLGDCVDPDAQEQIRENFVQLFLQSGFGFICAHLSCTVQNVNVICGENLRRNTDDQPSNSSEAFILTIQFDFAVPISNDTSVRESEQVLYSLAEETKKQVLSGNLTLKNITASEMESNKGSFSSGLSEFQCQDGMEPRYNTHSCVGCSAGSFYNITSKKCQKCLVGTFQDEDSQFRCKRCPYGYSTESDGATNSTDCKRECRPGTFSANGVQPCSPCNKGKYQSTSGQKSCISCPPATTTLLEGESEISACQNFDLQFPRPTQNISSCVKYENMEFQNASGITVSFWIWVDNGCQPNATIFHYHCMDTAEESNATAQYPCFYIKSPRSLRLGLRRGGNTTEIQMETSLSLETWHHVGITYSNIAGMYIVTVNGAVVVNGSLSDQGQHQRQEGISQRGSFWLGCHITEGTLNITDSFSGFISNMNIWNHTKNAMDVQDMSRTCVNTDVGNVVSWSQFGTAQQLKVSLQLPSLCDDTDECASKPCGDNQCVDQLRNYSCICQEGFTGRNCEINIDDCLDNVCENNATCLDGVGSYTCLCPDGFVGGFCEVESVDGNWTPWSQWSSCSASCGGGNYSRTRECINPRPMHGGNNCTGPSVEIGACNTEKCPVCKNLTDPVNGFATCNSTGDEINCTISCQDGFEFYDQPVLHYHCGRSTSYRWNHESPRNPMARYPPCSEVTMPKMLYLTHEMTYKNLPCKTKEEARLTKLKVEETIQTNVEDIECIKNNSCYVREINVKNFLGTSAESDTVKVTFEVSSTVTSESVADKKGSIAMDTEGSSSNKTEFIKYARNLVGTVTGLELAAIQLDNQTLNDVFTVYIKDVPYPVNTNASKTYGGTECDVGEIAVMFYCVPCPVGTRFSDGKCIQCDQGTYQNETGQVHCRTCPRCLTTEGFGALEEDDCNVETFCGQPVTHVTASEPDWKLIPWLVEVGVAAVIFGILAAIILGLYKCIRRTGAQGKRLLERSERPRSMYLHGEDNNIHIRETQI